MSITDKAIAAAAGLLCCDIAAIRAIDEVESRGAGFDTQGRVKILFEPHRFNAHSGGAYDLSHPHLSYPSWIAGAPSYRRDQHKVLAEAMALDADAALRATSWGRYQIMGDNYRAAGYRTLHAYVEAMRTSEDAHLAAFVSFVRADPRMYRALQKRDWETFARRYNGPAYAKHGYHTKLADAYKRHGGK